MRLEVERSVQRAVHPSVSSISLERSWWEKSKCKKMKMGSVHGALGREKGRGDFRASFLGLCVGSRQTGIMDVGRGRANL